jgi:hypothetical protein
VYPSCSRVSLITVYGGALVAAIFPHYLHE